MSERVRDVIFWGATGQAKVLRECIASQAMNLVALFDDTHGLASPFVDVPIYEGRSGFDAWLSGVTDPSEIGYLVAIGGEHGVARLRVHMYLEERGLRPLTAVHSTAFVAADVVLGEGSQVLAQSAVAVGARLGISCIVNTSAVVDHESQLGDGVHIAGGARLAGRVVVDDFATIYTGAVVLPRIRIGKGAVVGAGSVILADVEPWTIVAGNPAHVIGQRTRQLP